MANQKANSEAGLLAAQLGLSGIFLIADTTDYTDTSFVAIYVGSDAVFDNLEVADAVDVTVLAETNIGASTVPAGITIGDEQGRRFTRVKLASGTVVGIK